MGFVCGKFKEKWITIEVKGEPKTNKQLAYYYVAVIPAFREFLIEQGNAGSILSVDSLDLIIKKAVGFVETVMINGEPVDIPRLKRNSSKEEMSKLTEDAIHWLGTIGCYVAPPQDIG